jgi:hypothetical protein
MDSDDAIREVEYQLARTTTILTEIAALRAKLAELDAEAAEPSDTADSLRGENDPPFKTFLLAQLSHAEEIVRRRDDEQVYWQGRKDAIRTILAEYLNEPFLVAQANYSRFTGMRRSGR